MIKRKGWVSHVMNMGEERNADNFGGKTYMKKATLMV
jgi:hypothetical protein